MSLLRIGLVGFLLLVIACGGSDDGDEVLRLKDMDITESQLRAVWRANMTRAPEAARLVCNQIQGLSDQETIEYFRALNAMSTTTPQPVPNSTPRSGQAGEPEDLARAAQIYKAECERTF